MKSPQYWMALAGSKAEELSSVQQAELDDHPNEYVIALGAICTDHQNQIAVDVAAEEEGDSSTKGPLYRAKVRYSLDRFSARQRLLMAGLTGNHRLAQTLDEWYEIHGKNTYDPAEYSDDELTEIGAEIMGTWHDLTEGND